jgi:hypothetical protein
MDVEVAAVLQSRLDCATLKIDDPRNHLTGADVAFRI